MGEAKRRGTRSERVTQAVERERAERSARNERLRTLRVPQRRMGALTTAMAIVAGVDPENALGLRRQRVGPKRWTGPRDDDLSFDGVTLCRAVPPERWPYGPPDYHEACCRLHAGGLYCDCRASDAEDEEWGVLA